MPIKRGLLRRPLRIQGGCAGGGTSLDPGARGGGRIPASEGVPRAGWGGREADGAGDCVVLGAVAGEDALVRAIGDGVVVRDRRPAGGDRLVGEGDLAIPGGEGVASLRWGRQDWQDVVGGEDEVVVARAAVRV